jgi:hypothetical protein
MAAIGARLRADLRAGWRSWAAVALVIGLAGGVVLASAAGARRTDTAYPRLRRAGRASDLIVSPLGTGLPGYYRALSRLPGVEDLGVVVGISALPLLAGRPDPALTMALGDTRFGYQLERPKLVAGRLPHPDRIDEVVVSPDEARRLGLRLGSSMTMAAFAGNSTDLAAARRFGVRVVGIVVLPEKVVPVTLFDDKPTIVWGPAILSTLTPDYFGFDAAHVLLKPGTTTSAFAVQAQALAAGPYQQDAQGALIADRAELAAEVERAIRPQAVALALFALLAAGAAWLIAGQLLSRTIALVARDNPALRALGMSRTQLTVVGLAEAGLVAAAGGLVAAGVAVAGSPLMPIGPARVAEPHPGLEVNTALLAVGFAGVVVLMVARVAWPAWRLAGLPNTEAATSSGTGRPSALAEQANRHGLPVSAVIGLRLSLEPGRGRTAVPVHSALAGVTVALAAIAAALTFGTNLASLVGTPHQYGQQWDLAVNGQFNTFPTAVVDEFLGRQVGVSSWAFGDYGDVAIGGRAIPAVGIGAAHGALLFPSLLEGRPPASPDEIVLGTKDLRRAHRRVGQSVAVTVNGVPSQMRIVGRAIFPFFGRGSFTTTDLGEGAALLPERLAAAAPPAGPASAAGPGTPGQSPDIYNFVLVRLAPGRQRGAELAGFQRNLDASGLCTEQNGGCETAVQQRPGDILNYARVRSTPLVLAGLLALLAVATIAELLFTSVRQRRRDLAVLKTLGFVRRQVWSAVAWQASVLAAVGLLVGLPLGVAAGRSLWAIFASRLGVATDAQVPLAALLVAVPATLAVVNALAVGPGWAAGRIKPADALRAQ